MDQICNPDCCTGCSACLNICPASAIQMAEDRLGALHPSIDPSKCIDCKACAKICPVNKVPVFRNPLACYAAYVGKRRDPDRRLCASGGVATAFSRYVIREKQGVVYGTRWDAAFNLVVCRVEHEEELELLKGSKYVQSDIGLSYRAVRDDLLKGRTVLFVGTPCQVAGLQNFLRKPFDNLITVDLICHGVSPMSYFRDEVKYLKAKRSFARITDIRFRGNDRQNFRLSFWNGNRLLYSRSAYSQPYFSGFLKAVSLRENCYRCAYAQPARISDLTVGDFIGLGKDEPFSKPWSVCGNTSVVIVNTEKARLFYEQVKESVLGFVSEERSYSEAVKYGPSLRAPFSHHPLTARFRELYVEKGWAKAIRAVLWKSVLSNKVHILFSYSWRVPRKVCRVIRGIIKGMACR